MQTTLWHSFVATICLGCIDETVAPDDFGEECRYGQTTMPVRTVPQCLALRGTISGIDRDLNIEIITKVSAFRDSLLADTGNTNFNRAAEITRSLQRLTDYYSRELFTDSARFHRMMDHVLVMEEYTRGRPIRYIGGRWWPGATPFLAWVYYPNLGLYFQPVSTVQTVAYLEPRASVSTDTLLTMGEQFYRYALWREHGGLRFPVWEYQFPWTSSGVSVSAPWISGQGQAYGIILFAENFRRTGNPMWRNRAYEVLNSYRVFWDDGGVLVPDTSHGYWWEEFHPTVFIWNGAAQAVLAVGELWRATNDTEVKRMFDRSVEALKYYTPEFDTGTWTRYSRTAGYNTLAYHVVHIEIMDALFRVSGDQWFKDTADRWRTYVPPQALSNTSLLVMPR